jgi:hypothetical protein
VTDHQHLDLDALADVLAGEAAAPTCETCQAALDELRQAEVAVTAALAALGPAAVPDDLAARLETALREAGPVEAVDAPTGASVTTLPVAPADRAPTRRWLPAAAAAVVLAGGAGLAALSVGGGGADDGNDLAASSAERAAGGAGLVRNDTGRSYTKQDLASAVPGLLSGKLRQADLSATDGRSSGGSAAVPPAAPLASPQSATADSAGDLSRLRTTAGLADCLVALLPPEDESVQPLALDYGAFEGSPALLVVLPVPQRQDKLDVYVVGPGCSQLDEQLLHFARVDRPTG